MSMSLSPPIPQSDFRYAKNLRFSKEQISCSFKFLWMLWKSFTCLDHDSSAQDFFSVRIEASSDLSSIIRVRVLTGTKMLFRKEEIKALKLLLLIGLDVNGPGNVADPKR